MTFALRNVSGLTSRRRSPSRDIAYPPFLGEAFGGSTGLVDVGVEGHSREHAVYPYEDRCGSQLNVATAGGSPVGDLYDMYDPIAEVLHLLNLHPILIKTPEPVLGKPTYRLRTRVGTQLPARSVPDGSGTQEAHDRVQVAAVQRCVNTAGKLDRVGGRGLLRHHPVSIP